MQRKKSELFRFLPRKASYIRIKAPWGSGLTLIAARRRTGGRDTLLRKQPIAGATASRPSRTAGSAAPCQGCSPTHKTRALCGSGFNPTGLMLISILCRTEVRPTQPAAPCGSGFNPTVLTFIAILCRTGGRDTLLQALYPTFPHRGKGRLPPLPPGED